jgi:hypothetical protein
MFIATPLTQRDVGDLLRGSTKPPKAQEIDRSDFRIGGFKPDEFGAIWDRNPVKYWEAPLALIAGAGAARALIAWLWTYVPEARPITATTRIVEASTVRSMFEASPQEIYPENAWVALVFADALLNEGTKSESSRASFTACASTSSFVQARAAAIGYKVELITSLANSWAQVRSMVANQTAELPSVPMVTLWTALHQISGRIPSQDLFPAFTGKSGSLVPLVLREFWSEGTLNGDLKRALAGDRLAGVDLLDSKDRSRELRVKSIQDLLGEIQNSRGVSDTDPLLLGYLTNEVSPGTMEHFDLLRSTPPTLRAAVYWYAIFAGLSKNSTVGSAFGIGRRIAREIKRPFSWTDRPSSDIDLVELQVAVDSSKEAPIRSSLPGYLTVGLWPGVVTTVATIGPVDRDNESRQSMNDNLSDSVRKVYRLLDETRHTYEQLLRSMGLDGDDRRYPPKGGRKRQ